jgi:photoactive yellow protein
MALLKIEVDAESIAQEIGRLAPGDIDALPFGAIQLDRRGVVLAYNSAEEKISGRKRSDVIGRKFFDEVAPCTRVRRFFGAFQEGIERGALNEIFDFTFRFPNETREVRIRMIYSAAPLACVWIFVTPLAPL